MIPFSQFASLLSEANRIVHLQGFDEDPDVLDQLEAIFKVSGIRPDRNKEPFAAVVDDQGKVYGGCYAG